MLAKDLLTHYAVEHLSMRLIIVQARWVLLGSWSEVVGVVFLSITDCGFMHSFWCVPLIASAILTENSEDRKRRLARE